MRIAVVGAGIGGMAAARFLLEAGADVTVYEQAPELGEVGAGIQVGPNAVRLLHRLGLADTLREKAVVPEFAWEFRRWDDGRVLFRQPLGARAEELFGAPYYVVHRPELLEALVSGFPAARLRLGYRFEALEQQGQQVLVRFENGEEAVYDAVIGADGIHSKVRNTVVEPTPPRFSGLAAYRGLVPIERTPARNEPPKVTIWIGPKKHLVHYPISGGAKLNYVAVVPARGLDTESWTRQGSVEEAVAEFAGWHDDVTQVVGAADDLRQWALYDREPISHWTEGRVTLLGDAAHPMLPFFAQGAAQAIEDGCALAACLKDVTAAGVPEALDRYERARKPRAVKVQQLSRQRGMEYHLPDGPEQQERDRQLAESDPLGANTWLYQFDAGRIEEGAA